MIHPLHRPHTPALFLFVVSAGATGLVEPDFAGQDDFDPGAIFDEHWERLDKDYPFFDLYGVDWKAERDEHRPRAAAAEDATELVWEIARMLTVLPDNHVAYVPPIPVMKTWSVPDIKAQMIERKPHLISWNEESGLVAPLEYRDDPHAYPEVLSIAGAPIGCTTEILAAGPPGTSFDLRLRWPDGRETDEKILRPTTTLVPPKNKHYGEEWILSGRIGAIGYIRVKTFDPAMGTLGPAGKMTPILREHLAELADTEALILDFQENGGGMVAASDPFLSHFLDARISYRWGNSGGKRRTLVPRTPRYAAPLVALVDEKSASGGEWAARILRDAGRATVVGGRTQGAEAAVHQSKASDGSVIHFSAWPMIEPGVTPFQERGVELDHPIHLTLESVREHGLGEARRLVRRARYAKALELLEAPPEHLDELFALAGWAEGEEVTGPSPR